MKQMKCRSICVPHSRVESSYVVLEKVTAIFFLGWKRWSTLEDSMALFFKYEPLYLITTPRMTQTHNSFIYFDFGRMKFNFHSIFFKKISC